MSLIKIPDDLQGYNAIKFCKELRKIQDQDASDEEQVH